MQKAKPGRGQRVAEQIARDLAEIIPLEVRDPRVGLVTITGCEITPDYAHARVFFTVIGSDPAQCEAGLAAAAGMLRNKIFKKHPECNNVHFPRFSNLQHLYNMFHIRL